jgi:dihydroneopterin aldolase
MDYIELKGIKFHAYHGVMEQERKVGNTYTVDLKLFLDLSEAVVSDQLKNTVNYAEVWECIRKEMIIPSCLLEHVAGRIIYRIKNEFPSIQTIEIRLAKKNPPVGADFQEASVFIRR